jgi:hypothetical protein
MRPLVFALVLSSFLVACSDSETASSGAADSGGPTPAPDPSNLNGGGSQSSDAGTKADGATGLTDASVDLDADLDPDVIPTDGGCTRATTCTNGVCKCSGGPKDGVVCCDNKVATCAGKPDNCNVFCCR